LRLFLSELETASVILLLVSADFFASDYCYGIEMQRALARQKAGEALVIPILVRPVNWKDAPFAHLQALPTDAKPLSTWKNRDTALASVAAGLRRVIEDLPLLVASAPRAALPAVWNIPYPRNPFFLGREAVLAQIRHYLHANQATALSQPQAISGLGGIGKTQLVLEYAYRYHQDYQAVLWARAESKEALIASYITFATLLRLPEREATEQEIIVMAVKNWLQNHRGWLLILDNADELRMLPDFLPPTLDGHLLLTTRAAATGRLAHRLEIETLLPEQGALLLLRRASFIAPDASLEQASHQEQRLALQISEALGGLPLALDQAGAYLEETGTDLAEYWHIYQQHRTNLLQQRRGVVDDHPAPVATTWSLSFRKVEEKQPVATELLRLCAYLAPDAIPEEILVQGVSFLGSALKPIEVDVFLLNQPIEALRAYSLLRRDPREKTLSIHRLVQDVIKDELAEVERHLWAERAMLAVNAAFPHVTHDTWSQCERLLPHALLVAQYIQTYQIISEEAGRLLHETATYLHDRARYQEAEQLSQQALQIREQQFGLEHFEVASTLNILATTYRFQGKYPEAEALYQRALSIFEKQLGPEQSEVAFIHSNLATIYYHQGKYAEAEQRYQRALPIFEKQLGPEHPKVATLLTNLAELYRVQERYVEAEQRYQHALSIWKQQPGPEHPETANTFNNLAILYKDQGKYAEAEQFYQDALRNWEEQLGPDHPQTAIALFGLAELYYMQEKYSASEQFYQRVMPIWEKQLGPEHPNMAALFNNLAELSQAQGRYAEAEQFYQRALPIFEKQLGPEHPYVASVLNGLARLSCQQEKYTEAELLYQHALQIREQSLGTQHSDTVETMHALAQLRETQGTSEKARD
jgi:tetratricopeptide (TPR) repeat protein